MNRVRQTRCFGIIEFKGESPYTHARDIEWVFPLPVYRDDSPNFGRSRLAKQHPGFRVPKDKDSWICL